MKNLYMKIYNIMSEVSGLDKNMTVGNGKNSYNAISEMEVLNKIKPLLKQYKLILVPVKCDNKEINFSYQKSGYNDKLEHKAITMTSLCVTWQLIDCESGETMTLESVGNGTDTQDKGAGKAFTYAYKAVIQKTFMMFSGDDTDNSHSDDFDKSGVNKNIVKKSNDFEPPTDKQLSFMWSLAKNKNYSKEQLEKSIQKNFKKNVCQLSKQETKQCIDKLINIKNDH